MLNGKILQVLQKHPVDFCRFSIEVRVRKIHTHAHTCGHACRARAIGARRERRREKVERRNEQASTRARERARVHRTARMERARSGCENRRAKSNQWRAEAGVGGVTHVVQRRPIGTITAGGFRVGFPLGAPRLRSRVREMDGRKKVRECTRE